MRTLGLAALALFSFAACGTPEPSAPAADQPVLVRGNGPEPDSLDPQRARTVESGSVLRDLYEGLTAIGPDGAPIPAAAGSWTVSEDGLRYVFTLRSTARWSNGEPVVAADFAAALRRLVDPATASQYAQVVDVIRNAGEVIAGERSPGELAVRALDAQTLQIELAHPAPYLPALLSHWSTFPLNRASLMRHGSGFTKPGNHVSNGAFALARWVQGSHLDLTRNPHYWNDASTRLGGVRWISFADNATEYKRYRAQELHITATVPAPQFEQIRQQHAGELRLGPQLGTYFYAFNLRREPFASQVGLRRALSLVIDRQRLVESVTRVGELPAYGWVPPGTQGYQGQQFDYAALPMAERIEQARALYAAAGYSVAQPLRFELLYNTGDAHSRIAVAVAAMWKEALGLDVSLRAVEFKVLQQEVDSGDVDVFRLAWIGDYNDPYTFAQYFKSDFGINTPRYRSAAYDTALERAAEAIDPAVRAAELAIAERQLLADHPVMPLYFYISRHLVSRRVEGWYDNVMNVTYSKDLALRR